MLTIGRLALLFLLVPAVELFLLIRMGQLVGFWATLAFMILTGWAGVWLARLEGMRVLARFQQEIVMGRIPSQAIFDGVAVLVGAVLLIAPGVLTDVTGIALLFPPTRRLAQRWVRKRLERGIMDGSIRVLTSMPGRWRRPAESPETGGLDPSKGIVIESDETP